MVPAKNDRVSVFAVARPEFDSTGDPRVAAIHRYPEITRQQGTNHETQWQAAG